MKLRLAEFKEGVPLRVEQDYDPKQLDVEFVDLKYRKPLHLEGTAEKGPDTLTFRGRLTSEIEHICGRCLKAVSQPVDQPFELYYEIKGLESIETIDDLREVLILDHPITFVCRENCKGLCPACGANLNETQCRCVPERTPAPTGAFVKLKKLWEQKQEKK